MKSKKEAPRRVIGLSKLPIKLQKMSNAQLVSHVLQLGVLADRRNSDAIVALKELSDNNGIDSDQFETWDEVADEIADKLKRKTVKTEPREVTKLREVWEMLKAAVVEVHEHTDYKVSIQGGDCDPESEYDTEPPQLDLKMQPKEQQYIYIR